MDAGAEVEGSPEEQALVDIVNTSMKVRQRCPPAWASGESGAPVLAAIPCLGKGLDGLLTPHHLYTFVVIEMSCVEVRSCVADLATLLCRTGV